VKFHLRRQAEQLVENLARASDDERLEVFQILFDAYCRYCGTKQDGGRPCQCWNDE